MRVEKNAAKPSSIDENLEALNRDQDSPLAAAIGEAPGVAGEEQEGSTKTAPERARYSPGAPPAAATWTARRKKRPFCTDCR